MFAKLASARNKPNKQTLVPASAVPHLLQTVPLRDYRGLGGKFGEDVQAKIQPSTHAVDIQVLILTNYSLLVLSVHLARSAARYGYTNVQCLIVLTCDIVKLQVPLRTDAVVSTSVDS
jgi:hypothetical protein